MSKQNRIAIPTPQGPPICGRTSHAARGAGPAPQIPAHGAPAAPRAAQLFLALVHTYNALYMHILGYDSSSSTDVHIVRNINL